MAVLDKAFIADSIIIYKRESIGQNFVTWEELNYITDELEKRFKEILNIDVTFTSEIEDTIIFKISSEVIAKRKKYLTTSLKAEIDSLVIRQNIYSRNFILSCLYNITVQKLPLLFPHCSCLNCTNKCSRGFLSACQHWSHNISIDTDSVIKK